VCGACTDGSACDFVIHEAVDLGLSIEEAEERNRPYVCAVGAGCKKRYRQMNGLKVGPNYL
jgi:transcription factor SFP1